MIVTIEQAIQDAKQQLIKTGLLDSPLLDVELLLCHTLDVNRSYLFTWPEKELTTHQYEQFQQLIEQRLTHQPIAYILGNKEFWGLDLQVSSDTLIPRADTETLIEATLALKPVNINQCKILDLGTGTGAIALALKNEWPNSEITAVDFSLGALEVAKQNAINNQLNVNFLHSNWFSALTAKDFDIIVSNPPYIEENDQHIFQGDVQFEPRSALTSGKDGLDDIRLIIDQAWSFLKSDGWLVIEHGYNQAQVLQQLFTDKGYQHYQLHKDLAGNSRVSLAQKNESLDYDNT